MTACMPNLFTGDVEAGVRFYTGQLGFTVAFRAPTEGRVVHAVLRLGDSLLALSTPETVGAAGLRPGPGNPAELVVWCSDVDHETARLRAAGVPVLVDPYRHPSGHRRSYVADPAGNWVALVDAPEH